MIPYVSTLERAFELAKTGACISVVEIKKRLSAEGYSTAPITGKTLSKQLVALISQSQQSSNAHKYDRGDSTLSHYLTRDRPLSSGED